MCFAAAASLAIAQKPGSSTPRQEKLLNGLKILVWSDPAADRATVRIRFHGGSSFDPQGREGVMHLLSESFFPNAEARNFFTEELGGSLEIVSTYDYIQINASSRPAEFVTLLETIATAIASPTLDKEASDSLKAAATARVKELEKDPAYIADQAVAKRLFGSFPYARPQMGTFDSIQTIDFADLRFAKDRLLTADNATVAISGNVDTSLALRASRRYFGAWLKSDKKVPSTFARPETPEPEPKIINKMSPEGPMLLRIATLGVSRSDADYPVFEILARIAENRIKRRPQLAGEGVAFARNEAHILPGQIVFGGSNSKSGLKPTITPSTEKTENAGSFISQLLSPDIENDEFVSAKTQVAAKWNRREVDDFWLDVDTFKIDPAKGKLQGLDTVTLADAQRVAAKVKKQPVAMVWYFAEPST